MIYRDYSTNLSTRASAELLRTLAICNGKITDMFTLPGFELDFRKVSYVTGFFRLKFQNKDDLDKFHSFGFVTSDPPKVTLIPETNTPINPNELRTSFYQFEDVQDITAHFWSFIVNETNS